MSQYNYLFNFQSIHFKDKENDDFTALNTVYLVLLCKKKTENCLLISVAE